MVYISYPTEGGTLYSKAELTELYDVCRRYGLPLFIDGARLGYGVMADGADLTLPEIAHLCDVFYIGGTKVGALFGEAVVIMNPALKKDFRFIMKQRGGRLAKGRLLGIQFDALFTDDLYFRISRHADEMAYQIRDIFVSAGLSSAVRLPHQPAVPHYARYRSWPILGKNFGYEYWERTDRHPLRRALLCQLGHHSGERGRPPGCRAGAEKVTTAKRPNRYKDPRPTAGGPFGVSKRLFATLRHFSELQKALKNGDHHRAGHPSGFPAHTLPPR